MKKYVILPVIGVTLLAASCSNAPTSQGDASAKGPLEIAVNEPLSGPFGYFGQDVKNSIQIQVDKINREGGILGRQVKVVSTDNKLDPSLAVAAAKRYASDPAVTMIEGPSFTSFFDAAKGFYESGKKINCQVAVNGTDALKGLKYAFRMNQSQKITSEALVKWLAAHGTTKLGAIYQNDGEGQSADIENAAAAKKDGIKWLGSQTVSPTATSYDTQMQKLMKEGADAIYISPNATEAAIAAIAAKDQGYKGRLVGGNGLQGFTYIEGAGNAALGSIFASNYLGDYTRTPVAKRPAAYAEHSKLVKAKYGEDVGPKTGVTTIKGTQTAADCVYFWSEAVKKARSVKVGPVASAWENLTAPSSKVPTGQNINFAGGHEAWASTAQMVIYEWTKDSNGWYLKVMPKTGS